MEQLSSIVDAEIAKLLKEKEFEQTLEIGVICRLTNSVNKDYEITREIKKSDLDNLWCVFNETYPTIATVIDWIYDKHNIWVTVKRDYHNEELLGFESIIDNDEGFTDCGTFDKPKEAYLAGIKEVLTKII